MAEPSLHGEALKGVIRKRLEFAGLRGDVAFAQSEHGLSERTACKLLEVERSSYRYEPRPDGNAELRDELVKLARQKLPRQAARRVPQRNPVPDAERCPVYSGNLAGGLQLRTASQLAGLPHTTGVQTAVGLCRCGKQTTLPTSAHPRRRQGRLDTKTKLENSSYQWMRKREQAS